jgi:type I restriction enzyme R subunit
VRRVIRASLGNRAKESLMVDFINQTDLDKIIDKAGVMEAFYTFARAVQQCEVQELIRTENLNDEATRRYITTSLKREFASDSGTELNSILPRMSPLNPQFLTKKQNVFQKIAAFVERFKGAGDRCDASVYCLGLIVMYFVASRQGLETRKPSSALGFFLSCSIACV